MSSLCKVRGREEVLVRRQIQGEEMPMKILQIFGRLDLSRKVVGKVTNPGSTSSQGVKSKNSGSTRLCRVGV